jgi:biotin operon repressor
MSESDEANGRVRTVGGGFSTVGDEELVSAVKDMTPTGAKAVGDRVGLTRQAVSARLNRIEERYPDRPWVWSKKIGAARVWFHAEHVYPCTVGIPWSDDDSNPDFGRRGAMKPRRRFTTLSQRDVDQAVYRLTPAGTKEVGELLGISRQAADHRLTILYGEGNIWGKKVGAATVWMHPVVMPDPDGEASNQRARRLNPSYRATQWGTHTHPRENKARPSSD